MQYPFQYMLTVREQKKQQNCLKQHNAKSIEIPHDPFQKFEILKKHC